MQASCSADGCLHWGAVGGGAWCCGGRGLGKHQGRPRCTAAHPFQVMLACVALQKYPMLLPCAGGFSGALMTAARHPRRVRPKGNGSNRPGNDGIGGMGSRDKWCFNEALARVVELSALQTILGAVGNTSTCQMRGTVVAPPPPSQEDKVSKCRHTRTQYPLLPNRGYFLVHTLTALTHSSRTPTLPHLMAGACCP